MPAHRFTFSLLALLFSCGAEVAAEPKEGDGGILIVPASYREAMNSGGHLKHVGRFREDAGVKIACRDCHAIDSEGFKSPETTPCKTCHEDRSTFHHGPTDGGTLPDGGFLTCLTCHPFEVREGKVPVTPWICLDCHENGIAGKKAITVHNAACFNCHHPHEKTFTKPTECTVCHEQTLAHGAKGKNVVETCMECHERHTPAAEASKMCVGCHSDLKQQKSKQTLVTEQAIFKGHPSCGSCHRPHRFSKTEVKACTACHENKVVLARAVLSTFKNDPKKLFGHAKCTDCHDPHVGNSGTPKRCETCHDKLKNTHPPAKDDATGKHVCLQCHPPHEALPTGQVAKACASCHTDEAKFAGIVHGKDPKTKASLTCAQCHAPHAFKLSLEDKGQCKTCHATQLAAVAKMKKPGHAKCEDCHAGLPHKPGDKKACLSCHEKQQPPQKGHADKGCVSCHEVHSGARLKTCTDCHKVPDLLGLHVIGKHQKCDTCHAPHGAQPYLTRAACLGACHQKQVDHEPKADHCNACHLFRPLQPGDTPAKTKTK